MHSLQLAIGGATALSLTSILACLVVAPVIMNQVNDIWAELDQEMLEFRVGSRRLVVCRIAGLRTTYGSCMLGGGTRGLL